MALSTRASVCRGFPANPCSKAPCCYSSSIAIPFKATSLRLPKIIFKKQRGRPGRARAGLPVISSVPVIGPLVNTLLSPVVLFAVYAFGAFKFMSGFSKTTYADSLSTKVALTALWPVLFVVSQKFRSNFKKAVQ